MKITREVDALLSAIEAINAQCQQMADLDALPGQPSMPIPQFLGYVQRVSTAASNGQTARDNLLSVMTNAEVRDIILARIRPGPADFGTSWTALTSAVTAWRAAYGAIHSAVMNADSHAWTNNVLVPNSANVPASMIAANATLLTATADFI